MCKRKTVRPRVCEISPVYLWWNQRWKRLEEEMCFKSRVKKGVIDGERGGDDSVDPICVGLWERERPGCGRSSRKELGSLFQRRGYKELVTQFGNILIAIVRLLRVRLLVCWLHTFSSSCSSDSRSTAQQRSLLHLPMTRLLKFCRKLRTTKPVVFNG